MKFEDFAKIEAETMLSFVGRERPGSWHELLARRKAINDAYYKLVDLDQSEYEVKRS